MTETKPDDKDGTVAVTRSQLQKWRDWAHRRGLDLRDADPRHAKTWAGDSLVDEMDAVLAAPLPECGTNILQVLPLSPQPPTVTTSTHGATSRTSALREAYARRAVELGRELGPEDALDLADQLERELGESVEDSKAIVLENARLAEQLAAVRSTSGAPERLEQADPDDEDGYAKAIKENDDYVGACQYRGNTVIYIHGKAENYGRQLLECHRLSGAKAGQSAMDRILELVAFVSATQERK